MSERWGALRLGEHATSVTLDHQRGGWFAECSCGWKAKRPCWYKKRAAGGFAQKHLEESR